MSPEDELTPEEKFAAGDAETMVPRELMRGRSRQKIHAELLKLDYSQAAATALLDRICRDLQRYHASPESRQDLVNESRKQFLSGCILLIVGMLSVLLVFLSPVGSVVPLGCFAWGLVLMSRGWKRWQLYRRDKLPY